MSSLLANCEICPMLRHADSYQFVEPKTDVLDRVYSLLRPGKGNSLLFLSAAVGEGAILAGARGPLRQ